MKKPKIIPKGTFWVEKEQKLYMVRCPKCHLENWMPAAASGVCAWCGWDVNAEEYIQNMNTEEINAKKDEEKS